VRLGAAVDGTAPACPFDELVNVPADVQAAMHSASTVIVGMIRRAAMGQILDPLPWKH